ncbi:phosphoglycerate kinase [Candidatus Uhrbacteria bacterium]|nr:phosphoglycerate kinase [Candidatus Uhrbacteria bacterium]
MSMQLRTLAHLGDSRGKRVLLRVDWNVPMERSRIVDDTKIRLSLPTLAALRASGAAVIVVSHLREGATGDTLAPAVRAAGRLLGGRRPTLVRTAVGSPTLLRVCRALRPGAVLVLENIRRYPGEERNERAFARTLAALADVYVNDAFAACHRRHASVAAVADYLPAVAGLLLQREVEVLQRVLEQPAHPMIALMGGAKIATKAPVIDRLRRSASAVLLGGGLANTVWAVRGYGIGASLVDSDAAPVVRQLLRARRHGAVRMPVDVVVGDPSARGRGHRVVPVGPRPHVICERPEAVLDIGPATIRAYSAELRTAATMVWNGPMGWLECSPFHYGSVMLARVIASRASGRAFGVVGGGETLAALQQTQMAQYIDHVSSGGGAMLAFLGGEALPGLLPLYRTGA